MLCGKLSIRSNLPGRRTLTLCSSSKFIELAIILFDLNYAFKMHRIDIKLYSIFLITMASISIFFLDNFWIAVFFLTLGFFILKIFFQIEKRLDCFEWEMEPDPIFRMHYEDNKNKLSYKIANLIYKKYLSSY